MDLVWEEGRNYTGTFRSKARLSLESFVVLFFSLDSLQCAVYDNEGFQVLNEWISGKRNFALSMKIFTHANDVTVLVGSTEDRNLFFYTLYHYWAPAIAMINLNKSKALWMGISGCSFNLRGFTDYDKPFWGYRYFRNKLQ